MGIHFMFFEFYGNCGNDGVDSGMPASEAKEKQTCFYLYIVEYLVLNEQESSVGERTPAPFEVCMFFSSSSSLG